MLETLLSPVTLPLWLVVYLSFAGVILPIVLGLNLIATAPTNE